LRRNCLLKHVTQGEEEEEDDVNSYWKPLRKIGNTDNWNRKQQIALRGELAVD